MAISPNSSPILLLIILISTASASDIVSDLHSLQSRSPAGVIRLNETLLHRIFNSGNRSFYLIIFFDAIKFHDKPEPNLKSIKTKFELTAKSFSINTQNSSSSSSFSKLFFCDIELTESEIEFHRFDVPALPHIRIVPPFGNYSDSDYSIPMEVGEYATLSELIADFIEFKTGLTIGKIHRPPILSKPQLGFLITGFLIWMPFMIRKILAGNTLFHNKRVWIFGTLFVYFFSVSGSMFILIRKIPLFVIDPNDPNNKPVFFFNGNGMQFGFECVSVGFLFTIVGLLLAFITRIIVTMKDSTVQRAAMIGSMIVSVWAVREVVALNHWKTGYAVYAYLPSSWYK